MSVLMMMIGGDKPGVSPDIVTPGEKNYGSSHTKIISSSEQSLSAECQCQSIARSSNLILVVQSVLISERLFDFIDLFHIDS